MNDFINVSPLRLLDRSSQKGLGRGNLGVLLARAGVGKTACLIHIAFDKLFRKERLVHISLEDAPEKVMSYYNVIFYDLMKALNMPEDHESKVFLERNRMILAYFNRSFEIKRLRENIRNLIDKVEFVPDTLIVDGLDFTGTSREVFDGFKSIAIDYQVEIWFSALSHRHITDVNERGIPYPCNTMDDLFSIIIQLQPTQTGIFLKILKDHDNPVMPDASVRLDPNTFLVSEK
ncbi:MAG: hypothetical protein JW932_12305 [Deltaproteobacteria bacterium]|nr:hypothetical protein [Deltaproteobacteria bacterium]